MDAPGRQRRRILAVSLALLALLTFDLLRPPASQASARVLLAALDLYQATLSPRLPAFGLRCRFRPSCSHYAEGVVRKHGSLVGTALAARRLARCGPWTPAGTFDPP